MTELLAAPARGSFGVGDLVTAVRRQKLIVVLAAFAGLLGGGLLWRWMPPAYVAEAELVAEPPGSRAADEVGTDRPELPPDPAVTRTAVETIQSPTMIERAIQKLPPDLRAVLADAALAKAGAGPSLCPSQDGKPAVATAIPEMLRAPVVLLCDTFTRRAASSTAATETEEVRNNRTMGAFVARKLEVRNDGRSYIIRVRYASAQPQLAAAVANAVVNEYLAYRAEQKTQNSGEAIGSLESKLKSLTVELHAAERTAQEMREQVRLQELRSGALTEQQASGLLAELMAARTKRMQAEARLEAAANAPNGNGGTAAAEVLNSRLIQQLREREAELRDRSAQLSATLGSTNPAVRAVRGELAEAQRSISAEVSRIVSSLQADVAATRAQESAIVQTLHGQEQAITQSGEAFAKLRQAERVTQAIAAVYDRFLLRQRDLAARQHLPEANIRLLSAAQIPLTPTGLGAGTLAGFGGLSGMLVGMSIAVVRGRRKQAHDPLVLGRQALDDALDVTFVPRIPQLRTSPSRYVLECPTSAYAEALHWIRAALLARFEGAGRRVVMVASALPAEGKSSFCLALASAMAVAGETAVVVDCDLRKMPKEGPGRSDGDAAVTRRLPDYGDLGATLQEGGHGLPSRVRFGAGRRLPQAILSSHRFASLINSLAAHFDYVILDTPPLAVAADALFVGFQADECLMLSKWKTTPSDLVRGAVTDMRARGINVPALIVNQAEPAGNPLTSYRSYSGGAYGANVGRRPSSSGITVEHPPSSQTPPA